MGKKTTTVIELMQKGDVDTVLAIEQASFSMPWSKNLFLSEFRSPSVSTLLVSLDNDRSVRIVTGYIVFWNVEDEMHILNLAVAPEHRRQGISRQLVLTAVKRAYARGARRALLEVRASNEAARKLYSNLGFTGTSVRRDYYESPIEDAVIMTLVAGAFEQIANQ